MDRRYTTSVSIRRQSTVTNLVSSDTKNRYETYNVQKSPARSVSSNKKIRITSDPVPYDCPYYSNKINYRTRMRPPVLVQDNSASKYKNGTYSTPGEKNRQNILLKTEINNTAKSPKLEIQNL